MFYCQVLAIAHHKYTTHMFMGVARKKERKRERDIERAGVGGGGRMCAEDQVWWYHSIS